MPIRLLEAVFRSEITVTPMDDQTHLRWSATWDATYRGRFVWKSLHKLYPQLVKAVSIQAEQEAKDL